MLARRRASARARRAALSASASASSSGVNAAKPSCLARMILISHPRLRTEGSPRLGVTSTGDVDGEARSSAPSSSSSQWPNRSASDLDKKAAGSAPDVAVVRGDRRSAASHVERSAEGRTRHQAERAAEKTSRVVELARENGIPFPAALGTCLVTNPGFELPGRNPAAKAGVAKMAASASVVRLSVAELTANSSSSICRNACAPRRRHGRACPGCSRAWRSRGCDAPMRQLLPR